MTAYYNEIDPIAAQWLRNLIAAGLIAPGDVDERSITDVRPADLRGYTQCHFFAGIGVWSLALRRAGWPDDRPVWTGSCPCQPFSGAGKSGGFADERHLWPHWHYLVAQRRPGVVFGEQVASKDGLNWLDLVQADLEGTGYACGPVDLCAAGFGAPHIRQRLWFVAERLDDADHAGLEGHAGDDGRGEERADPGRFPAGGPAQGFAAGHVPGGADGGVGHPDHLGSGRHPGAVPCTQGEAERRVRGEPHGGQFTGATGGVDTGGWRGPTDGYWGAADWLFCRDGKWRPVRPGSFPLAHGAPARVGRLRAYGNAIVAPVAQALIESYLDVEAERAGRADLSECAFCDHWFDQELLGRYGCPNCEGEGLDDELI